MIEVICDKFGLYKVDKNDIVVKNPSQYESALDEIKQKSIIGDALRVIVKNPAMFQWFDAAQKYGAKIKEVDPIDELENIFNSSITPKYLKKNPDLIVEWELIEKSKKEKKANETIDLFLKRFFLGGEWIKENINSEDLSKIINFLSKRDHSDNNLVNELVMNQLSCWIDKKSGYFDFLSWIFDEPYKKSKFIVWEQMLSKFPEIEVISWLEKDNIWYKLSKFPGRKQLPEIESNINLPEYITAFVRKFIADKWEESPETAIDYISGNFEYEKKFLLEKLNDYLKNQTSLEAAVFYKIRKFTKFKDVIKSANSLFITDEPGFLEDSCSVNEIIRWISDKYLPFYDSCSVLGKLDLTKPYVSFFEKWLQKNYSSLLFGKSMAYMQFEHVKKIVNSNEPLIIIVFDGLNYTCAINDLLPLFTENGFSPIGNTDPYFALLPTQTQITKPTLVSGRMHSQIPEETPDSLFYEKLLNQAVNNKDKIIRAKSEKESSLSELLIEPADVYLYLDNHLDQEILHKNIPEYIRKKKYSDYVTRQAKEIIRCINDFKETYQKELNLIICSDHGYTLIPPKPDIIHIHSENDTKFKSRTLFSDDIESEKIWKLNSHMYGLRQNVSVSLGYSCFEKKPFGATHGGCTPQEMAVPWFVLSKSKPKELIPLNIVFKGDIYRKKSFNEIKIQILNRNNYSVTILNMSITDFNGSPFENIIIGPNDFYELKSSYDASKILENSIELKIKYHLRSINGEKRIETEQTKTTTGAMTNDFDDEFEF